MISNPTSRTLEKKCWETTLSPVKDPIPMGKYLSHEVRAIIIRKRCARVSLRRKKHREEFSFYRRSQRWLNTIDAKFLRANWPSGSSGKFQKGQSPQGRTGRSSYTPCLTQRNLQVNIKYIWNRPNWNNASGVSCRPTYNFSEMSAFIGQFPAGLEWNGRAGLSGRPKSSSGGPPRFWYFWKHM